MIAKEEQFKLEGDIFALRHETGIQLLRRWLFEQRDHANSRWPTLKGDELSELQGEVRAVAKVLKLIDTGPVFKGGGV